MTPASQRNRLVSICNPTDALRSGGPGYTEEYPEVAKEWMKISPISSQDRWLYGDRIGTITHTIKSPWNELITTRTHLVCEGRTFHVQGVLDKNDLHDEMEITAVEQAARV